MKILINIYNLTSGGGLTLGLGLVEELYKLDSSNDYIVVLPNKKPYDFEEKPNIHLIKLPNFYYTYLGKLLVNRKIVRLTKQNSIDKILNLTNYGLKTKIPQKLLIHWPYLVYSDKELWEKMSFLSKFKRKINVIRVKNNINQSFKIIVQTQEMLNKMNSLFKNLNIDIIPAFHNFSKTVESKINNPIKKLLFPSNFYEHKNHEILIPLAKEIEKQNLDLEIYITIPKNHLFAQKITNFECICNLGAISNTELEDIYPTMDGLFFPTLIETFGIPYIEAMHFNLPIFTSNKEFAIDVCREYAIYFNPNNVNSILQSILNFENIRREKPNYPTRSEVVRKLLEF